MRALAVLAVVGIHVGVLPGGYLGVDVFFVLSGFLITSLLIREWDNRKGSISFRSFYARRILRLFPALGCVVLAAVVLALLLDVAGGAGDRPFALATFGAVPWVGLFAGNFAFILHPGMGALTLGALGHTWSLAIEEQFYLLWPGLLVLALRRRIRRSSLALSLAALAAAEMIYRMAMAHAGYGYDRIYYGTDTHSDGLLIGCALAFWMASGKTFTPHKMESRLIKAASWFGAAVLMILFVIGNQAAAPVDITAAVLASGVIVAGVALGGTPAALERLFCSRWAVHIGRRSYGLYLWHWVFLAAAEALCARATGLYPAGLGERRFIFAAALGGAIAASLIVTGLSYRFVELPVLRLKRRFRWEEDSIRSPSEPDVKSRPVDRHVGLSPDTVAPID
jgi:peptidoglycan/LPS O-acetylase OafA/YrhL